VGIDPAARVYALSGPVRIGAETVIERGAIISPCHGAVTIGERCFIGPYAILYGHGGLTIGDDVLIAGHTMIVPSNHNFAELDRPIREQGTTDRGIVVGSDMWIGTHVTVLDGVRIGDGAVVAAGAVVNRDVPSLAIVGGVPARVIDSRTSGVRFGAGRATRAA
jgi:acetyltransferase-like isoleucine patch superfamily enzyme